MNKQDTLKKKIQKLVNIVILLNRSLCCDPDTLLLRKNTKFNYTVILLNKNKEYSK